VNEPSTSSGKRARTELFSTQQEIDFFAGDSESDEEDIERDYETESESSIDHEAGQGEDRSRSSESGDNNDRYVGGHGTRPADRGDADQGQVDLDLHDGWTDVFTRPAVDLKQLFVNQNIGPQNLPDDITNDSNPIDFLDLCVLVYFGWEPRNRDTL